MEYYTTENTLKMINNKSKLPSLSELIAESEIQSFAIGGPVPAKPEASMLLSGIISRTRDNSAVSLRKQQSLNPLTYPKPDYSFSKNSFLGYIPEAKTLIGGVSGRYDSKKLSIGANAAATANMTAVKLPVDYGMNVQYRPNDRFSANLQLNKGNVGAGAAYRFKKGGPMRYLKAQNGMLVPQRRIAVPKTRNSQIIEHTSRQNYDMPAYMKQRKDTAQEIAAQREQRIVASVKARDIPWTKDNWREKMAAETSATGDKLSLQQLPIVGKYIPGALDATAGIGHMASSLGSAPLHAKQSNSLMPYVAAVGMPLAAGALGGLGAKNVKQFANNMLNPLAGIVDIKKGVNKILPTAHTRSNVTALREALSSVEAPARSIGASPNYMRRSLGQLHPTEFTPEVLGKLTPAEVEHLHQISFPNESNMDWRMHAGIFSRNRNEAEFLGRTENSNKLFEGMIGGGQTKATSKDHIQEIVMNRNPHSSVGDYTSFAPPTKGVVLSASLPKRPREYLSKVLEFKDKLVRAVAEGRQTNAFNPKSIYYNTKNKLPGDSDHHEFFNITPSQVSERVDGVIQGIPKGGRFSESSLSSDSFRLLTPKLGATKEFNIINTGKLQALNGHGKKGEELRRMYGSSEGSQKTAELMNSYIERLERSTGKKITRAKVMDGQVYVPQLIAQKKGGSTLNTLARSKNQLALAASPAVGTAIGVAVSTVKDVLNKKQQK